MAILLSAVFVSCKDKDEDDLQATAKKGGVIGFNAEIDGFRKPTTRIINGEEDIDQFFVIGVKQNISTKKWSNVFDVPYTPEGNFGCAAVTHTGNHECLYSPVAYWENGYNYKFKAGYIKNLNYAKGEGFDNFYWSMPITVEDGNPFGEDGVTPDIYTHLRGYKSANDPRDNSDIMVAKQVYRKYSVDHNSSNVVLDFNHIMCQVRFRLRSEDNKTLYIKSFVVKNYRKRGDCIVYDAGEGKDFASWYFTNEGGGGIMPDGPDIDLEDPNPNPGGSGKSGEGEGGTGESGSVLAAEKYFDFIKGEDGLGMPWELKHEQEGEIVTQQYLLDKLLYIPQPLFTNAVSGIAEGEGGSTYGEGDMNFMDIDQIIHVEMEFYYEGEENNPLSAVADLSGHGQIMEWLPGHRYTYTINVFKHQVDCFIDVEDWKNHRYEELIE